MKTKNILSIILGVLIFMLLAACGDDDANNNAGNDDDAGYASYNQVFETSGGGNGYQASSPPAAERLVIKNAEMSIEVEDPAETMDQITQMALSYRGYVVESDLKQYTLDDGTEVPFASINIRVPGENLVEALEKIENQAISVQSKNQSGEDITKQYTDLKSRLRNLEDAAEQLRQIMDTTGETDDVLAVYRELTQVTEQIEVIKGQIQYYDESVAFSSISVTISTYEEEKEISIGGWQPVGVAKDAVQALINALQVIINIFIWLLIFIVPVLAVLSLPFLAWKRIKKAIKTRSEKPSKKD